MFWIVTCDVCEKRGRRNQGTDKGLHIDVDAAGDK
jgi:hypothetical protein